MQRVYGDGAYDSHRFRKKIANKGAEPRIPPRKNGIPKDEGDAATEKRNHAIYEILGLGGDGFGRRLWKNLVGYHTRSLVETTMFRFKKLFGSDLRSKLLGHQYTESYVKCLILNKMTRLGMPVGRWEEVTVRR